MKILSPAVAILLGLFSSSLGNAQPKNQQTVDMPESIKTLQEIKNRHPIASKENAWIYHTYKGRKFVFCFDSYGYGAFWFALYGWYYDPKVNYWQDLVMFTGPGGGHLEFDDAKGICTVRGYTNDKFKDKALLVINLRPTLER